MSGQMTYLKTTLMVLAMMSGAAALPVQATIANCSVTSPSLTVPDISLSSTTWVTGKPVGPSSHVTVNFTCYIGPPTDSADRYYATLVVNEDFREAIQALTSAHLGLNLEITDGTGNPGALTWDQIKTTGAGSDVKVSFGAKLNPTGKGDTTTRTATLTGTFIATEGKPPSVPVNINVAGTQKAFDIRPVSSGTYNSVGKIGTSAFNVRLFPANTGKICISTFGPETGSGACPGNGPFYATVNFGHLYATSVDTLTRTSPFWVNATQSVGTTSSQGFDVPLSVEFVSGGEALTDGGQAIKLHKAGTPEENGLVLSISDQNGQKVTFNQSAPMNTSLHFEPGHGTYTTSQKYIAKVEPASNNAEIKTGQFQANLVVKVTYN
ncbi:hypothetical protein [Salmonella enterica]|uniref:hypothetical protein n=1 Tax=Salmonella enterica TaxID=28901 RepID=UPI0009ABDAC5|nr:hypothetical protein [Salmonella enterica]